MARPLNIGVAVLAAGASRRFGDTDKLAARFLGAPLAEHVIRALPMEVFDSGWIVTPPRSAFAPANLRDKGFDILENPQAETGMGSSVALSAAAALDRGLDGLVIALADMPLVPTEHYRRLAQALMDEPDIWLSGDGAKLSPPAGFGAQHLQELAKLKGDKGARDLLLSGQKLLCPAAWLADVDTPDDIVRLETQVRSQS